MKTTEFITHLSLRTGQTKVVCTEFLNAFKNIIYEALINEEEVGLTGFGTFKTVNNRKFFKNPLTGEKVPPKHKKLPLFTTGADFKKIVNKEK